MMHNYRMFVVLVGSALLLAGCADRVTDPAGVPMQASSANANQGVTWTEDMTGIVYQIDCEPGVKSEPVALEGEIVYRFNVVIDGRGGVHISFVARPNGLRGVGLDSGEVYRVAEHSQEAWTTTPSASNGTYRSRLTMVGRESGQRFTVVYYGHYTMNANGEIVAGRGDSSVECRL
jgi:hypothetical protein